MISERGQNYGTSSLFSRVIAENMELDWQCAHPQDTATQNNEPAYEVPSDPNVEYIFTLCSSIKEKLDALQQAAGREELTDYAESHLKEIITDLLDIESKIENSTEGLNAISDTLNNLAANSGTGQPVMVNGLISL